MFRTRSAIALVALLAVTATACDDDEDGPQEPQAEVFTAVLTGDAERPNRVTTSATGNARIEFTPTGLSWTVNVSNITGVTTGGAHIHGPATTEQSAGVLLGLNPNNTVTSGLLASGSATVPTAATVSMDSLKKLIRGGLTYVNVHTTANTAGHIRGQLVKGN